MGARDLRRAATIRRILESTIATLTGGMILWWMTLPAARSASQPQPEKVSQSVPLAWSAEPSTRSGEDRPVPPIEPAAAPPIPSLAAETTRQSLATRPDTIRLPEVPDLLVAPATANSYPIGTDPALTPGPSPTSGRGEKYGPPPILLFENFSRYREGAVTDWGPNTSVKLGLDRRKWLVSYVDGVHTVGRNLRLPNEFYLECRYSAYVPDATRGLMGWWREPILSRITLVNDRGARYVIEWSVGCESEKMRLNLLGPPPAGKYYHSIKLPGAAAANEVEVAQPDGTLRIARDKNVINVLLNGQLVAAGMLTQVEHFVRFEVDLVKAKNGSLFFTEFKVAR